MATTADILIIGGGIAGLSAAARLGPHGRVVVLEAEDQIGYHSSGRSATMLHYALGDRLIRELTRASRPFFENPPTDFQDAPVAHRMPVLVFARDDERPALDALKAELDDFAQLEALDQRGVAELCPLLRTGPGGATCGIADRNGLRLDPHALLQGNLRMLRRTGGALVTGARVRQIARAGAEWQVATAAGSYSAPIIINAAGAWADSVAQMAGVAPLQLQPRRRTIITFDAPDGTALEKLPFAKTVGNELYFAPESGRLFASPMDEVASDPCDAQPDELEIALAAHRVEERTTVKVRSIYSRWAGLRTFAPDGHPLVGFDPDAEGFFWLAGQGGSGLQTSPAIAAIVEGLIVQSAPQSAGSNAGDLSPARFRDDRIPGSAGVANC